MSTQNKVEIVLGVTPAEYAKQNGMTDAVKEVIKKSDLEARTPEQKERDELKQQIDELKTVVKHLTKNRSGADRHFEDLDRREKKRKEAIRGYIESKIAYIEEGLEAAIPYIKNITFSYDVEFPEAEKNPLHVGYCYECEVEFLADSTGVIVDGHECN
jgi:hypothetical protein